jgi:hypothetical protein
MKNRPSGCVRHVAALLFRVRRADESRACADLVSRPGNSHIVRKSVQIACTVVLLVGLNACGSDDDAPPAGLTGTLAYVVSECRENGEGVWFQQRLLVQRQENEPQTIFEIPWRGPFEPLGLCPLYGNTRLGMVSLLADPMQRIGVSPDGSQIVFEVTDDFSLQGADQMVAPEEEGIFIVRADGSGLRRLGPAGRDPDWVVVLDPQGGKGWIGGVFAFDPPGNRIVFRDIGPAPTPSGEPSSQIFTMDLTGGERKQLTFLEKMQQVADFFPTVWNPNFLNSDTVAFPTWDADHGIRVFRVLAESREVVEVEILDGPPDSTVVTNPVITGAPTNVLALMSGTDNCDHFNPFPIERPCVEIYAGDEKDAFNPEIDANLVQVTKFDRSDTGWGGWLLGADRQHAILVASANPFGTNNSENCQIFSVDTLGENLRQLTQFRAAGENAGNGCYDVFPPGCSINFSGLDLRSDTLLFRSSCDPFGTNPFGGQIFTMRSDGTALRQLTNARGLTVEADGTIAVELPGPVAYSQPGQFDR